MLKNIPEIISPELMKALMEMGHGDELTLGDINFPSVSKSRQSISARGHSNCELLEAILQFLPLDAYNDTCVTLMAPSGSWDEKDFPVWKSYREIIQRNDTCNAFKNFEYVDNQEFYRRAQNSFATVATSEKSAYGCIILRKGAIV